MYFTYSSRDNNRVSTNPEWSNPAGWGRTQQFTTHYIRIGHDHSFGASVLNHLNLGFNRTNSKNIGAGVGMGGGQDWASTLIMEGLRAGCFPSLIPGSQTSPAWVMP